MAWQDRLKKASFRGFEFLTDDHDTRYGHRLVVHEYPKRDDPEIEDFGNKSNDYSISAYFIGPDYDLEANGFNAKLNIPGAAWLQHPWLGQVWVRAHEWSRTETNEQGGFCTIKITFVPGGRAPSVPAVDKVDVAIDKTNALSQAIVDDFDLQPMNNNTLTAYVAEAQQHIEHIRKAISVASLPLQWVNAGLGLITEVKTEIATLLQTPQQYADALLSAVDSVVTGADFIGNITSSTRANAVTRIINSALSPADIEKSTAPEALNANFKLNAQADAALRTNLLVAGAAQLAIADYTDAQSRDLVLVKVIKAIDTQLPSMSDDVFNQAIDARAALIDVLLDQDLTPTTSRSVVNPLPAVVLAYQMGIDEASFNAQNNVAHPLFVQGTVYG